MSPPRRLVFFATSTERIPSRVSVAVASVLVMTATAGYARHNGHADLLREVIDGETGD
jgi:hypothetical protein